MNDFEVSAYMYLLNFVEVTGFTNWKISKLKNTYILYIDDIEFTRITYDDDGFKKSDVIENYCKSVME